MAVIKAAGAGAKAHDARCFDQLAGKISTIATSNTAELQATHLASRFGLAANRARLVASLHFGEAR